MFIHNGNGLMGGTVGPPLKTLWGSERVVAHEHTGNQLARGSESADGQVMAAAHV